MHAFRICDDRYSVLDGAGAALAGARWNSKGHAAIYAAEVYSLALLETLVHAGFRKLPGGRHYARILIPDSVAVESFEAAAHPGWDAEDHIISRAFGDSWLSQRRSAVLRMPSAATKGPEWNILINPVHPQFPLITVESAQAVYWDHRLLLR
jgi:RES domain-containing protein